MSLIILNFHGVGPVSRSVEPGEHSCWLDQDFFERILGLVKGQPHVRLTFDDGNASDIEIVLPALLRRGLTATFFICSGRLDQPTFLSAAQVRELQSKGMHIGSHGVDHVSWRRLTRHQLQDDLRTSRVKLGDICGSAVDSAACPFGEYDRVVLGELWNSGYKTVYTSDGGAADGDDWIKPRTTITRGTRLFDLALLVQKGVGRCRQLKIDLHRMIKRVRP